MRRPILCLLIALLVPVFAGAADPRLAVHVRNQFGFPVADLKAEDFVVTLDKEPRQVARLEYVKDELADILLLVETSEIGMRLRREVEGVALLFIDRLAEKQQMGIIGYALSADLVQDLTSSKELLRRGLGRLKYGNPPALLDSVYAAVDGGFENAPGRRILVVIGSGMSAREKVKRAEVISLAQRRNTSIYAISFGRDFDLEKITEETAGDYYRGKYLKQIGHVVEAISNSFRGHYELTLPGPAVATGKLKVEVKRDDKLRVSFRPLSE